MPLYLVAPAIDLSLELNLPGPLEQAFSIQWERLANPKARDLFCQRLEKQLETLLPGLIDWDIQEPTPNQKAFARAIAEGLGIPIPTEATLYRGHMHAFLDQNAQLFKLLQATIKAQPKS